MLVLGLFFLLFRAFRQIPLLPHRETPPLYLQEMDKRIRASTQGTEREETPEENSTHTVFQKQVRFIEYFFRV